MTKKLFYGDNLDVLREHIASDSIDLIYLDPPFNSNAGYNVLFKSASGAGADASIEAFDDTWTWGDSAKHLTSAGTGLACRFRRHTSIASTGTLMIEAPIGYPI